MMIPSARPAAPAGKLKVAPTAATKAAKLAAKPKVAAAPAAKPNASPGGASERCESAGDAGRSLMPIRITIAEASKEKRKGEEEIG
ncbi:hypothetical protein E2562_023122 [Oryza meyeriana var. granulata]|uniref:Uncharacterized protein n=1 Tax=Oryza meyeriana var. granulata TaxID=110450 RepID=A0A6G1E1B4_9ORYZ|nr:hypothetical protein E2562_023122 [Oryza meyeriana var. granulata]